MTPLFGGRTRHYAPPVADQPIHDVHQARAAWAALQHAGGLMGRAELAERWGVSRPRAGVLVATPGFPEPVESHGRTDLWLVAEVDEWMRAWSERERRRGPKPRHLDDAGER